MLETRGPTERYGSVVAVDEGSALRARRGYVPEHDCLCAASGDFPAIRALMTSRPHRYTVRSGDDRAGRSADHGPEHDVGRHHDVRLHEVRPEDASLESVFGYLVDEGGSR